MKKIAFLAAGCLVAAAAITSCDSKQASTEYTEAERAFGDSTAIALGHVAGAQEAQNYQRMLEQLPEEQRANFSKEEFIRGVETVLKSDTANIAYLNGLYCGLNLYGPVVGTTTDAGCPVDPNLVLKSFKETFTADSISPEQLSQYTEAYQNIMQRTRAMIDEKRRSKQAAEAAKNAEEGQAYIKEQLNNGFKKTESGLVYKINNPGTEPKVAADNRIKVSYVGKHVNGEIFDQSQTPYEAGVTNFIPGFTEGLQLLGKGGSATIIIPGELAYGEQGAGRDIGPNETLVFDITIDDIVE